MSVPSETSDFVTTGNGVLVSFDFPFRFKLNSEIVVKVTNPGGSQITYTQGLTYTVTGAGDDDGGTILFLAAPVNLASILIERTVEITQEVSLSRTGSYNPEAIEDALDEGVFVDQQLARRIAALESAAVDFGAVVAGNGLSLSGATLNVGAGDGIIANADTIEVDWTAAPLATTSTPGDMSAADKLKLDGITSLPVSTTSYQTLNATPLNALSLVMTNLSTEVLELTVTASKKTTNIGCGFVLIATLRCFGDVAKIIGKTLTIAHMEAAWDVNLTTTGSDKQVTIVLTGGAYAVDWSVEVRRRVAQST